MPLVAAADRVPDRYMLYYDDTVGRHRPDPRGLSVRYYSASGPKPKSCSAAKPEFTAIDPALDYQYSDRTRTLGWPGGEKSAPPVYWAKWTGSLNILMAGNYSFQLDLGFETTSELKIDGRTVLTPGQCEVARSRTSCEKRGCHWDPDSFPFCGAPPAPVAAAPKVPVAAPAPATRFLASTASPPSRAVAAPASHAPPTVELQEGGHCVEVTVLVTPGGRTARLLYGGPDTNDYRIAVPSAVLFCDPVIQACTAPAVQACKPCGLASGPAAAAHAKLGFH